MEVENKLKVYFNQQVSSIDTEINIENMVMDRIDDPVPRKRVKTKRMKTKRILVYAMMISVVFIGTGLTFGKEIVNIVKEMVFKNDEGEVEWSIVDVDYTDDERAHKELLESIYDGLDLSDGKAVAIYTKEYNPQDTFTVYGGLIRTDDLEIINSYTQRLCKTNVEYTMFDTFHFVDGCVSLEPQTSFELYEELKAEAKETGEVVVRELEVSDVPTSVYYSFLENTGEETELSLFICEWRGGQIIRYSDGEDDVIESIIVSVAGAEVLYENHIDSKDVTWIADGVKYSITAKNKDMTQERLISIVEQIKQQ